MKLKKLILLVPMLLSLSACNGGKDTVAGTYSFQLGSDNSTHTGIHLTLTDDDFGKEIEGVGETKKFSLEFDVAAQGVNVAGFFINFDDLKELLNGNTELIDQYVAPVKNANDSSETTSSEESSEDQKTTITGYYYVTEETVKEASGRIVTENRLHLGVTVLDDYQIDDDIVEKILYATITDTAVNVVIPVSIMDFLYQLYWYGYRISSLDELFDPTDLEVESNKVLKHHDVGTHPGQGDETKERAIEIIQGYQRDRKETATNYHIAEDLFLNYRDYHTLDMGLTKDGTK